MFYIINGLTIHRITVQFYRRTVRKKKINPYMYDFMVTGSLRMTHRIVVITPLKEMKVISTINAFIMISQICLHKNTVTESIMVVH